MKACLARENKAAKSALKHIIRKPSQWRRKSKAKSSAKIDSARLAGGVWLGMWRKQCGGGGIMSENNMARIAYLS